MNRIIISFIMLGFFASAELKAFEPTSDPNFYQGSDSERILRAIEGSASNGGVVHIGPRRPDDLSDRDYWLLDSAILLPANTTLYLDNCVLKLSDRCRDNFIRSANSGLGVKRVEPIENVRVVGIGDVKLIGADRPRATGDSGKKLGERTYGADAGLADESQTGDWRNIGVLFANVQNFSIENLSIIQAHAWSVSLEKCSYGKVNNLRFNSLEKRVIDGKDVNVLNVDGLNLRKGCHDVVVENITGITGDDLVALTAIGKEKQEGGTVESTQVCDYAEDELSDIYNVSIRNVMGYSSGGHQIIRLLNASGIKIRRVNIDGVIDASPEDVVDRATIRIGDSNPAWGGVTPLGDTSGVIITNVQSRSAAAVLIAGSLTDSIISNVINYNPKVEGPTFESGETNVRNVQITPFINQVKEN